LEPDIIQEVWKTLKPYFEEKLSGTNFTGPEKMEAVLTKISTSEARLCNLFGRRKANLVAPQK
jgi:hypothetical protein